MPKSAEYKQVLSTSIAQESHMLRPRHIAHDTSEMPQHTQEQYAMAQASASAGAKVWAVPLPVSSSISCLSLTDAPATDASPSRQTPTRQTPSAASPSRLPSTDTTAAKATPVRRSLGMPSGSEPNSKPHELKPGEHSLASAATPVLGGQDASGLHPPFLALGAPAMPTATPATPAATLAVHDASHAVQEAAGEAQAAVVVADPENNQPHDILASPPRPNRKRRLDPRVPVAMPALAMKRPTLICTPKIKQNMLSLQSALANYENDPEALMTATIRTLMFV